MEGNGEGPRGLVRRQHDRDNAVLGAHRNPVLGECLFRAHAYERQVTCRTIARARCVGIEQHGKSEYDRATSCPTRCIDALEVEQPS